LLFISLLLLLLPYLMLLLMFLLLLLLLPASCCCWQCFCWCCSSGPILVLLLMISLTDPAFLLSVTLLQMCKDLGIDTGPVALGHQLLIVPLLSWYNHHFDTQDPR
jgi:hypothetical protein